MAQKLNMAKEKFLKTYDESESLAVICRKLNITRSQMRYYLRKYHISEPSSKRLEMLEKQEAFKDEVFFHFRSMRTMRSLAIEYNISLPVLREIIQSRIEKMYNVKDPPIWPKPKTIAQIKITKLLIIADEYHDWHSIHDIDQMARDTWLPRKSVEEYYAIEKVAEELEHRKHFIEFQEEDRIKEMSPVEQLCELCRDPYEVPAECQLTELEKDKMMAEKTLRGKEHLSPTEQLRALMIEQREQFMAEHIHEYKF